MSHPCHKDKIANIRRIKGQLEGIERMINDEKYCIDILNQMKQLAVHAANEATNDSMLLEADQMEFEELLSAMEQKSERTTFAG